ncbi:MAG: hypothetical protein N2C14_31270, partial [Planctomycetales bacterium]
MTRFTLLASFLFVILVVDPVGAAMVYVTNFIGGSVVSVDLDSGDRTLISGGGVGSGPALVNPTGMLLDASGNILLTNRGSGADNLLRIDVATGNRSLVSGATLGSGPNFATPNDLDLDPASGLLFVTNQAANSVYAVDPVTGNRTVVSNGVGSGAPFQTPVGLQFINSGD